MNIEEYAELLDRKEWKNKRESILKRDDYTCQKCGRRGFSFRSFKISGYSELNNLMKGWTIEDAPVVEYLKKIQSVFTRKTKSSAITITERKQ